jgi:arylsulfatase A
MKSNRPTRREFIKLFCTTVLSTLFYHNFSCQGQIQGKPNILLIMSDDLGWQDLSCYGNEFVQTPNIDHMAREGIKLTQYYSASAVCTPTRASVLTGKYPLRFNIRKHFTDEGEFLPLCTTLPKLLKTAGYNTAHVGKWHLGGLRIKDCQIRDQVPGPHQHGFDFYLTQREEQPLRGQMGQDKILYRKGGTCLLKNDTIVGPDDPYYNMYYTDINGEETVRLIKEFNHTGNPFFINLWWLSPHTPYEPAPEPHWSQTAEKGIPEDQHRFRSMVARMDFQFGRILNTLDELGISQNTLIFFVSDYGGAYESNIGKLKGGKTDLHEGGIRVPCLIRWPGHIHPGSVSPELCHSNDMLPTICAAAGVSLPKDDHFDGLNLLPWLRENKPFPGRGTVFWQVNLYPHLQRYYPKPQPYATEIARRGKWKMLALNGKPVELYDIESDTLEQHDLLKKKPEIVESLQKVLDLWLKEPRQQFGQIK